MRGGIPILILIGLFTSCITVILFLVLCTNIVVSYIKKTPFPKKLLIATLSGVLIVSSIYIYESYFFTFNKIDREYTQIGPGPIVSPTEDYIANAYYEPYGGAAGGVNVWVEITKQNNDHEKKIIYYSDAKDNFMIEWVDDNTLFITNTSPNNHSIRLDVETEIYHDRGLACKSLIMKRAYEACYHE